MQALNVARRRWAGALVAGWLLSAFGCGNAEGDGSASGGSDGGGEAGSDGVSGAVSGGVGGNSGGGSAGAAVIDSRPARPEWSAPFPVAEAGWRESKEPLCVVNQGRTDAFSVWADERGAFALGSVTCNALAGVSCGKQGVSLQFNPGDGWRTLYQIPPSGTLSSELQLTGFPGGAPIIHGVLEGTFGVFLLNDGVPQLGAALQGMSSAVYVVDSAHAYAVDGRHVLEYSGGSFREFAELPGPGRAIWADAETIVVVGDGQGFYVRGPRSAQFVPFSDVPAGDYVSVWGFGGEDFWAGNAIGQIIHYDGVTWQVVSVDGNPDDPAVVGLWGSERQLYFRTRYDFGRIVNGSSEILMRGRADDSAQARVTVTGLWGLSASEVFVTLDDHDYRSYACGEHFIVWFDGSQFHQF